MTVNELYDKIFCLLVDGFVDKNAEIEFDFETGTMCEVASVDDICVEDDKLVLSGFYKHKLGDEE